MPAKRNIVLTRTKSKPGSAVQRFGEWQKGEPTVIVDNQKWLSLGKPNELTVTFGLKTQENADLGELTSSDSQIYEKILTLCA